MWFGAPDIQLGEELHITLYHSEIDSSAGKSTSQFDPW